jgi:N-carbamoylputrescine amidase
MSMSEDVQDNLSRAERAVRQAAAAGANLILLPELFAGIYFCQTQRECYFDWAHPLSDHPWLPRFACLAKELGVALPISFFEREGNLHYNSVVWMDPDGRSQGVYRKSHIPDGPGYQEKYYFRPGNTGFRCWDTPWGRVGVGICWDQWFPEAARSMVLQGADLLLYPTAIGSEPPETAELDTRPMWLRAQVGHAVSNACHVAAANRVGKEGQAVFYGHSFVADPQGEFLALAGEAEEVLVVELDLSKNRAYRAAMGFFRDRRPDLYDDLIRK